MAGNVETRSGSMAKKKILVIDDDKFILQMFKDILEAKGYNVVVSIGGKEAVEEYKNQKPDLVIVDILMPGMDGIRVIKKILKIDKKAKIIVATALTKLGLEKSCLRAGAKAFIMKPFELTTLMSTIRDVSEK